MTEFETLANEIRTTSLELAEMLAKKRSGRKKWERETNAYQRELGTIYDGWSLEWSRKIAAAGTDDDKNKLIAAAIALLLFDMRQAGREYILDGALLGLGNYRVSPRLLEAIARHLRENERYLEMSFGAAVERKLREAAYDPDVIATGALAIAGILMTLHARAELYAGGMWTAIQLGTGEAARQQGEQGGDERVFWKLEPQAEHCKDCLAFGDREYESFDRMLLETGGAMPGSGVQCDGNCRCALMIWRNGAWVRP